MLKRVDEFNGKDVVKVGLCDVGQDYQILKEDVRMKVKRELQVCIYYGKLDQMLCICIYIVFKG